MFSYTILYFFLCFFCSLSVFNNNPIYSVFWLIAFFSCSAVFLVKRGLEYIPLIVVIVYMGAIAVLFLFVVMLLDFKKKYKNDFLNFDYSDSIFIGYGRTNTRVISLVVSSFALTYRKYYSVFIFKSYYTPFNSVYYLEVPFINNIIHFSDLELLGAVLYNEFYTFFLVTTRILLTALIVSVQIAKVYRSSMRTQSISTQLLRNPIRRFSLNFFLFKRALTSLFLA